jgi:hypothetical protein
MNTRNKIEYKKKGFCREPRKMIDVFMKIFQDIMDEEEEENSEEEVVEKPPPEKKQKLVIVAVAKEDCCLSAEEAVDIAFAAFDYFICKKYDGDVTYIYAARDYGKRVCKKAQYLKTEHKTLFDACAIIDAFQQLS